MGTYCCTSERYKTSYPQDFVMETPTAGNYETDMEQFCSAEWFRIRRMPNGPKKEAALFAVF